MRCPSCKFDNPEGFKYCGECGLSLTDQESLSDYSDKRESERRQITVMFCDLVNSTALSENLDTEIFHNLITTYQEVSEKIIRRFEGHIAQYLGDGILVYFGYPTAHEDDAQRAVLAGLEITNEIKKLNAKLVENIEILEKIPLQVRIGIHTGPVMVGEIGSGQKSDHLALGDTPNITARILQTAEPNQVIASSFTYDLVEGYFSSDSLGYHEFKGISNPLVLYHIIEASELSNRFKIKTLKGLTPFVGRGQELSKLVNAWENVISGSKQIAFIEGEAGIGKSRLLQEFVETDLTSKPNIMELQCSPYYQNSSFFPVINYLEKSIEFSRNRTEQSKLEKLENFLKDLGFHLKEVLPLFSFLLSVPLTQEYEPLNLGPMKQREKTFEVLCELIIRSSKKNNLILTIEDIHWADPSTLELLDLLINNKESCPIMIILTYRPEFEPTWSLPCSTNTIALSSLEQEHAKLLLSKAVDEKGIPEELSQMLIDKSGGNPLHIEELTKTVLVSGYLEEQDEKYELIEPLESIQMPATLKDSLMERLDKLSSSRETAQLASALGRQFPFALISEVSDTDEISLENELSYLVDEELLYITASESNPLYEFKHALIQDTTYDSMTNSKRKNFHERIAMTLENKFTSEVEIRPEYAAYQFTEAGIQDKAVHYWQKAGQKSIQAAAYNEGFNHLHKGLDLLGSIPDSPEKSLQEISLRSTLGGALIDTRGYASPDVQNQYTIANELCEKLGNDVAGSQLYIIIHGLWLYYAFSGNLSYSQNLAEQLVNIAEKSKLPFPLIGAYQAKGLTKMFMGEMTEAIEYFEKLRDIYDSQVVPPVVRVGADPTVAAISNGGLALMILGYPEKSKKWNDDAIDIANNIGHPYNEIFAKSLYMFQHYFSNDYDSLKKETINLINEQQEYGFPLFLAINKMWNGYAETMLGNKQEGLEKFMNGLEIWKMMGSKLLLSYNYLVYAQILIESGQFGKALEITQTAIEETQEIQERLFEAELHRLRGEILLELSDENEAGKSFRISLEIARNQDAKLWELRSLVSISKLSNHRGNADQISEQLSNTLSHFDATSKIEEILQARKLLNR